VLAKHDENYMPPELKECTKNHDSGTRPLRADSGVHLALMLGVIPLIGAARGYQAWDAVGVLAVGRPGGVCRARVRLSRVCLRHRRLLGALHRDELELVVADLLQGRRGVGRARGFVPAVDSDRVAVDARGRRIQPAPARSR
jgi:hypothetical protein